MGQKPQFPKVQNFRPKHQFTYHPSMSIKSDLTVMKHIQTEQKIIEYAFGVSSKEATKYWQQKLKQYFQDVDTTLFYLPIKYYYKSGGMCGNAGIMKVYYEYYPSTLFREINNKIKNCQVFSEDQIWRLLYVLSSAAYVLHRKQKKIGQIGLESIMVNKCGDRYSYKIATGLTFFGDMLIDQIIAPQNFHQQSGLSKPSIKLQQSFCIGMILLCTMLLVPKPPILQTITSNYANLDKLLNQLQNCKFYSLQLKEIVSRMCNVNPLLRIIPDIVLRFLEVEETGANGEFVTIRTGAAGEILKESDKQGERVANNVRLTFGVYLPGSGNSSYDENPKNNSYMIEKTQSQYINGSKKNQQLDYPYSQLIQFVDQQLQNSRKTFPSSSSIYGPQ